MQDQKQQIMTRSDRLEHLKKYFFDNLEDCIDDTQFNNDVVNAIDVLKKKYRDPNVKSIIGFHTGCGGNIIQKNACSWCDKCKQYFCGCACG